MNKHVVFILFSFISVIMSAGVVNAGDIPEGHKPIPCAGCHGENLDASTGASQSECAGCHNYMLNVPKLQEEHNPKICRACHMGNTYVNASMKEIFHNGHNAVDCTTCHTQDNSTVIKIEGIEKQGFQCVLCHGNQVHTIHLKNLGKICPICHGSWAKDKVYITNSPISSNDSEQKKNLERFTIFALIKQIFNTIFGVI